MNTEQRPISWGRTLIPGVLVSSLLAACGGGGGASPSPVGGVINGLSPGTTLTLGVAGSTETFSTASYAALSFKFQQLFASGSSYSVSVEKHPQGQMCAVTAGAAGTVEGPVSSVKVDCHDTLLNDTGILAAANGTVLAPDGATGRDAQAARLTKIGAGELGFDFTRICSSGHPLDASNACPASPAYPTNVWTCTRDNVTGLMWLKDSRGMADSAPTAGLCGHIGWRQPTVHELMSIVHAGKGSGAAVDLAYFPATPATVFQSSDAYLDVDGKSWSVDFGNQGSAGKDVSAPGSARVRWVAGASLINDADPSVQPYTRSAAGSDFVIVDTRRELMWLIPNQPTLSSWTEAVSGVQSVNASLPGGYGDWRLPNRNEMDSLAVRSLTKPAMDAGFYGGDANRSTFSQMFWTGSPYVSQAQGTGPAMAWGADFSYGDVSPMLQSFKARVIYVRNRVFNTTP
ncbi:Lcl C-terminal domain-containing protein [Azohydromonas lata]|uniref:DUF1566 domain-containing protein n=1 Tax=Azohydromonas lata TaxID=45677 RepID=A0ABU5IDS2_9BURK|nr:DUF1566 domain-containing protein [Azohydromonas lata]MDZ5456696.1 DUF1566 domain-containing protein [Azohydromonas lata]